MKASKEPHVRFLAVPARLDTLVRCVMVDKLMESEVRMAYTLN